MELCDFFIRITLSGILAGVIGLEREIRSKDAGLKTHFLVGIGSALIMIISKYGFNDILGMKGVALDPSRIAAQVVSGISFLGAGTIILEKHYVRGLTTAAGIWATAGIGLAIGSGMYTLGIFSTALVLIGLEILNRIFRNTLARYLDINIWISDSSLPEDVKKMINGNDFSLVKMKSKKVIYENNPNVSLIELKLKTSRKDDSFKLADKLNNNNKILKIEIMQNPT